jgi:hypothetical protein
MRKELSIVLIILGISICVGLGIMTNKLIYERYRLLGANGEEIKRVLHTATPVDTNEYPYKKFLGTLRTRSNKNRRGAAYDRARLRYV